MRSAGRFFYFDEDRLRPHLGSGLCLADTAHRTTMYDRPLYGDTHCAEISVALRRHHSLQSLVRNHYVMYATRVDPPVGRGAGCSCGCSPTGWPRREGHLGDKVA